MTTNTDEKPATDDGLGGYAEMFEEYRSASPWIGPAELPLVFHLRKLCRQLDASGLDKAAMSSAYLQAFARLDKRRPGAAGDAGDGLGPQLGFTFDEMGD